MSGKRIALAQAEEMAKKANINGVAAFMKQQKEQREHESSTLQVLRETLLESYLASIEDIGIDQYTFACIKRIANL